MNTLNDRRLMCAGVVLALIFTLNESVLARDLSGVAKRLAKGVATLENKHVAVLPFAYPHEEISSGSSLVAERLTTELVERHVSVVERSQLDKVLSEIKLEMTGTMSAVSAQKLGKMLGVDAIVTGTLNDFENQETEVNARLIRTETGEILAAGMATIKRPWTDAPHKAPAVSAVPTDMTPKSESNLHMSELIPVHFGPNGGGTVPHEAGYSRPQPYQRSQFDTPPIADYSRPHRSTVYYQTSAPASSSSSR